MDVLEWPTCAYAVTSFVVIINVLSEDTNTNLQCSNVVVFCRLIARELQIIPGLDIAKLITHDERKNPETLGHLWLIFCHIFFKVFINLP